MVNVKNWYSLGRKIIGKFSYMELKEVKRIVGLIFTFVKNSLSQRGFVSKLYLYGIILFNIQSTFDLTRLIT